jgi:pimeloyl-ACP methyl ester carboxylesterase
MATESFHPEDGAEQRGSFDEQFEHPDQVRLPFGTAEVGDFTPEHMKDEMPILLAQAWGLGLETYKPAMRELFNNKRRALSIAHPRIGGGLDSSMNAGNLSEGYPKAELRKAFNSLEMLEEKNIKQVDVIAHSEGAINIALAAAMYPEKIRSIVFYGPAGMMEDESWARLAKGFGSQGTRSETIKDVPITDDERAVGAAAMEDLKEYFLKNPGRAISEIAAIKNGHRAVKDLLPYLHDKFGINIAVMSAEGDPVFPQAEVRKAADMGAVDAFISVPGGHGMLGEHPEIIMPIALKQLETFAKREKTPEQKQALADREYQAGVRYIPGEGLKISDYIKRGE